LLDKKIAYRIPCIPSSLIFFVSIATGTLARASKPAARGQDYLGIMIWRR
jgi:hypothetical protein